MTSTDGHANTLRARRVADDDDLRMPRPARDEWPVLASIYRLDRLGRAGLTPSAPRVRRRLFDGALHEKLLLVAAPGDGMPCAAAHAESDFRDLDPEVRKSMTNAWRICTVGGKRYARLCALAYRQCVARTKLVAAGWRTFIFQGKISAMLHCNVDVTCPSCPFFLLFNTTAAGGPTDPILDYARMPRWSTPMPRMTSASTPRPTDRFMAAVRSRTRTNACRGMR